MIFKKIHILGFGKLSDFSLDFLDGANVVYGRNEDGKTTIMAFIKMMFYGTTKKQSESFNNPRKRYQPLNDATFGGSIEFVSDNTNYRLERQFKGSNSTDKITLYNLDRLEPIGLKSNDVGSEFFSLSADAFEKSVYIGNIGYEDLSGAGGEINSKLANISLTGDEDVSFDLIKKRIETFKGIYTTPRKVGTLDALKKQLFSLREDLADALDDQKQRQTIAEKAEHLKSEKILLEAKLKEYNDSINSLKESIKFESLKQKLETANKYEQYKMDIAALEGELCLDGKLPTKSDMDLCFSSLAVLDSLKLKLDGLGTNTPKEDIDLNDELEKKTNQLKQIEDRLNTPTVKRGYLKTTVLCSSFLLGAVSVFFATKTILFMIPAVLFSLLFLGLLLFNLNQNSKLNAKKSQLTAQKAELYNAIQEIRLKKLESDRDTSAIETSIKGQIDDEFKKVTDILNQFCVDPIETVAKARALAEQKAQKLAELDRIKTKLSTLSGIVDINEIDNIKAEFTRLESLNLSPATDKDIDLTTKNAEQTALKISEINSQIANLNGILGSSFNNKKQVSQIENEIEQLTQNCELFENLVSASDIALKALQDAYSSLRGSFGGVLNKKTAEILNGLTNGKYTKVGVSDSLNVNLDSGILTDARQFSSGTLDQAYFALRLAVAELMSNDLGGLPILLDDAFLQYDDERMKNGFRFLADYKGQSVMFTCRREFAEFAKTLKNTNIINL